MTAMTSTLTRLSAETWGEKFRRARDRAGLNVRQTAELIEPYVAISYSTLARIERNSETRPSGRAAQVAFVALLAYGIDPADFGLDKLAECRALDAEAILSELRRRSSGRSPSAGSGSSPRRSGCSDRWGLSPFTVIRGEADKRAA
jgi:transcriptional regulator with XRE-family HTH domain